jgi:Phospholipase_D-nuclease N-terminal
MDRQEATRFHPSWVKTGHRSLATVASPIDGVMEGGEGMIAAEYPLGGIIWTLLVLYLWFMLIWMFVAAFADIFRRRDLSGFAKALWLLLIFALPFLGILIYVIARPSVGDQGPAYTREPVEPYRTA